MQALKQWEISIGFNWFATSLQKFLLVIKFLNFFMVFWVEEFLGWKLEQYICFMLTFRSKELDASDFWRLCSMQLPHRIIHNVCKKLVYIMDQLNISIRNTRNLTECFVFIFHLVIQNWKLWCSIPCYKYLLFTKDICMLNLTQACVRAL